MPTACKAQAACFDVKIRYTGAADDRADDLPKGKFEVRTYFLITFFTSVFNACACVVLHTVVRSTHLRSI